MHILKRILQHTGFQRYAQNTGWLFLGKIFSFFTIFIVGIYVARYLGPTDFGLLNYVISIVSIFAFLSNFGVDNILRREVVQKKYDQDVLLGTSFVIRFLGGTVAFLVVCTITFFIQEIFFTKLLIVLFSLTYIFQAFFVIDIYFQAQVLSHRVVKIHMLTTFVSALLKVIFILMGLGVFWFLLVYIIDTVLMSLGFVGVYATRHHSILKWRFEKKLFFALLRNSLPLMLSGAALIIFMKIDQVLIRGLLDITSVGIYSVAVSFAELWYFIPTIIATSLFPALVNAKNTNSVSYTKRIKKLYTFLFYVSILIALPLSIFANHIIVFLYGPAYASAASILQIYIWSSPAVFLGVATSQYLIAENFTGIIFARNLVSMIVNIVLNILFIPLYGLVGAAVATVVSYFGVLFSLFFFKRTRRHARMLLNVFSWR